MDGLSIYSLNGCIYSELLRFACGYAGVWRPGAMPVAPLLCSSDFYDWWYSCFISRNYIFVILEDIFFCQKVLSIIPAHSIPSIQWRLPSSVGFPYDQINPQWLYCQVSPKKRRLGKYLNVYKTNLLRIQYSLFGYNKWGLVGLGILVFFCMATGSGHQTFLPVLHGKFVWNHNYLTYFGHCHFLACLWNI